MNKHDEVYFMCFKSSVGAFKIVVWICRLSQHFGSTAWYFSTKQVPFHRSFNYARKLNTLWQNPCRVSHRLNWSAEQKDTLASFCCQTPQPWQTADHCVLLCPLLFIPPASCTNIHPPPNQPQGWTKAGHTQRGISSQRESQVWDGLCKHLFYHSWM